MALSCPLFIPCALRCFAYIKWSVKCMRICQVAHKYLTDQLRSIYCTVYLSAFSLAGCIGKTKTCGRVFMFSGPNSFPFQFPFGDEGPVSPGTFPVGPLHYFLDNPSCPLSLSEPVSEGKGFAHQMALQSLSILSFYEFSHSFILHH